MLADPSSWQLLGAIPAQVLLGNSLTCWHRGELGLVSGLARALRMDGSSQSRKHPRAAQSMLGCGRCQPRPAPAASLAGWAGARLCINRFQDGMGEGDKACGCSYLRKWEKSLSEGEKRHKATGKGNGGMGGGSSGDRLDPL